MSRGQAPRHGCLGHLAVSDNSRGELAAAFIHDVARLFHDGRPRLLALYALLAGVGWIIHALPGEPYYVENWAYALWIAVDVLLFVLIARGSRFATGFAIGLRLFPAVVLLLDAGAEGGAVPAGTIAFATAVAAQTIVLVALWRRPRLLRLATG